MKFIEIYDDFTLFRDEIKSFLKIENNEEDLILESIIKSVDRYAEDLISTSILGKTIRLEINKEAIQTNSRNYKFKTQNIFQILNYKINNTDLDIANLLFTKKESYTLFRLENGLNVIRLKIEPIQNYDLKIKAIQHIGLIYNNREDFNENTSNAINAIYRSSKNLKF